VSAAATLSDALQPLRADPARSAVLLDVDGVLAPIVRHADDAAVPEPTRALLIPVVRRYGVVACVSGRDASTARRIVSLGTIAYVGSHGAEILRPGGSEAELDREAAAWEPRIRRFVDELAGAALHRLRVRIEHKRLMSAFHWRGAPDEPAAEAAVRDVARRAEEAGFWTHWGRKVLEVRPPVPLDKGRGVRRLLRDADLAAAVYVGDDLTDLDAFDGLRDLAGQGRVRDVVCVGVRSEETPPRLLEQADLLVDGPAGVRLLLEALL
jgi:trehalose 6-phosphate phosphatase